MLRDDDLKERIAKKKKGGDPKYHQKNAQQKKLFARDRLDLLLDKDSFVEDALLANATDPELPADGVVTGVGT
ncbi:MAG: carboxyl transferase domain-containing protein, partial [Polyangiaceae bacterium]